MKNHFMFAVFALCFSTFATAQNQLQLNESAASKYKKADLELNKTYKSLTSKLGVGEKSLLITAQKEWIKFRDSHCKFEGAIYEGGSMQGMIISECLTELTKKRIGDLKTSIQNRN